MQILILHKLYIIDKESDLLETKWGHSAFKRVKYVQKHYSAHQNVYLSAFVSYSICSMHEEAFGIVR